MKQAPYPYYITLAVICQAIAALFLGNTPVSANANNFHFSDYTADYYLEATDDGSRLKVSEQLTAEFPSYNQNHGIERAIPFTNQGGANLTAPTIDSLNFTATRDGQPENISTTTENDYYIFRLGDPNSYLHGTQKYQLEYEFTNVITNQSRTSTSQPQCFQAPCPQETTTYNFQELYWDTNGTGWSQKFDRVTANFHLEKSLLHNLKNSTWCYVGVQGSNNQSRCTTTQTDDGFTFTATELQPGENLTFVINFDADTFIVPAPRGNYILLILTGISAVIFIAAIIVFFLQYRKNIHPHRQYYKHLFTPPQYTPHPNHTVADAAAIYLKTTKSAQVPTLLELAVNHKIELIKADKKTWKIKTRDLTNLTAAQNAVIEILANSPITQPGYEFTIQKQKYSSTNAARRVTFHTAPTESLRQQGYLEAKTPRNTFLALLTAAQVVLIIIASCSLDTPGVLCPGLLFAIAALTFAVAIIAVIYGSLNNKYVARTKKGLDLSNYYQGLKDYIQLAEADRLKFLQSVEGADTAEGIVKLYEKVLPYAALFGLEKSWLAELDKYYEENPNLSPDWCTGAAIGHLSSSDFNSFSSAANSSYSSASSSDSGSGSGGGGSSGGGGGGGGGGGW